MIAIFWAIPHAVLHTKVIATLIILLRFNNHAVFNMRCVSCERQYTCDNMHKELLLMCGLHAVLLLTQHTTTR